MILAVMNANNIKYFIYNFTKPKLFKAIPNAVFLFFG